MGTALVSVVAFLYNRMETRNTVAIADLKTEVAEQKKVCESLRTSADKCEEDRSKLFAACQLHEYQIETLKRELSKMDNDGTKYSHLSESKKA